MQPKKNSPSRTQLTVLETIEAQIAQQNELLSQYQHQVRVLTTRNSRLKDEIESGTARLLDERDKQLAKLAKDREQSLAHQEKLLIAAEKHLAELRELELRLDNRLQDLYKQFQALQTDITRAQGKYNGIVSAVETIESRNMETRAITTALQGEKSGLEGRIPVLQQECELLESKKRDLEVANEDLATDFMRSQKEYEQKLHALVLKQQQTRENIQEQQNTDEAIKKDLVIRLRVIEEREKVVHIRELKVVQNEQIIQHNAELLNL